MKSIFLILLLIVTLSCQREERNQLGVEYNKTLIIPPTNDLPKPKSSKEYTSNNNITNNNVINSIFEQSNIEGADLSIIDKIDEESGYKSDENFLQWLFKGQSRR